MNAVSEIRDIKAYMQGLGEAAREAFIARTADLISAGVTSTVTVAGLQGLFGGLSFAVLGLSGPVFWGVVMGLACLLPLGAGIIWLPAALYLDRKSTRLNSSHT